MTAGRDGELVGVVLAGGRSRRFGSDKASAELGGRSLLERALTALAPSVDRRAVVLAAPADGDDGDARVAGSDRRADRDARDAWAAHGRGIVTLRDAAPDVGPLEGVRVALAWARDVNARGALVTACDLPLLDAGTVAALARAWRDRGPDARHGVVPVAGGLDQPLAAAYSVEALAVIERRLAGADRSLRGMLRDLDVLRVPAERLVPGGSRLPPEARFLNVNTPAERERARALLDAGPGEESHGG